MIYLEAPLFQLFFWHLQELLRISKYVGEATVEPPISSSSSSNFETSDFDEDTFITDMPITVMYDDEEGMAGTTEDNKNNDTLKTEIVREGELAITNASVTTLSDSLIEGNDNVTSVVAVAGSNHDINYHLFSIVVGVLFYFVMLV